MAIVRAPVAWLPGSVEQRVGDLLGDAGEALQDAIADTDAVVHLAVVNEQRAKLNPEDALVDTLRIAHRVATAATAVGAARLVVVSTVHAYGGSMGPGVVLTEELAPSPRTIYAVANVGTEHVASAATAGTGTDLVVFRSTNLVGAPADPSVDRWSLVANDLCRQAVTKGRLELKTHGAQWRDFVAMADACRVLAAAAGPGGPTAVPAGTYNLGQGECLRIRDLAGLIQASGEAAAGRRPELVAPDPPADAPGPYTVSVRRLAELGFTPHVPIRAAIDETIEFCRTHRGAL